MMLWLVLGVVCLLLLLLLLYVVWSRVADADLTLLWNEQFGLKPGEMLTACSVVARTSRDGPQLTD